MTDKWLRREKKEKSKKSRMPVHGRSLKTLGLFRYYNTVYDTVLVGMVFKDDSKARVLRVVRKHDFIEDSWFCSREDNNVEVLYAYKRTFILKNLVAR